MGRGESGPGRRIRPRDRERGWPQERVWCPGGAASVCCGRAAAILAEAAGRGAARVEPDWTDTGLLFTRENGTALPPQWVSVRFETLAYRAGLPPVRFHDLRHGAASMCKAAGLDTKFISALLGHSRTSFTDATYVLVFPEVAKAAAEAAAAIVPRKRRASNATEM